MKTYRKLRSIPIDLVKAIAKANESKGSQELHKQQSPEMLETLTEIARIQSVESSNRIEGIEVTGKKLKEIVEQKTFPRDRNEEELSGYRDVLATIHASFAGIPLKPQTILQVHRDMYKYLPEPGGRWKSGGNAIEEIHPDGRKVVRFQPISVFETPQAIENLCNEFNSLREKGDTEPLLLVFSFILDFLCIHPFSDGNGRVSRLLMLLLLYQAGFEVGRYISLERIIEESKETYYDVLYRSSQGWHENEHDPLPWLNYSLGTVIRAYKEFEDRVGLVANQRGAKGSLVRNTVMNFPGDFAMKDIKNACPNVGRPTINRVLRKLKEQGLIECVEKGRYARYRKK